MVKYSEMTLDELAKEVRVAVYNEEKAKANVASAKLELKMAEAFTELTAYTTEVVDGKNAETRKAQATAYVYDAEAVQKAQDDLYSCEVALASASARRAAVYAYISLATSSHNAYDY